MANFQRTKHYAYVKLGKRQKSMRKYRRATGRHNKTRQKWRSRPPRVEVGYKNRFETRNLLNEKTPVMVYNLNDLDKVTKDSIAIIGKIGNKAKLEIAKQIISRKLEVYNLNVKKFIKQIERDMKLRKRKPEEKKHETKPEMKKEEKNHEEKNKTETKAMENKK